MMIKETHLVVLILLAVAGCASDRKLNGLPHPTKAHSFTEQYDLDLPSRKGKASLELSTNIVTIGESCEADVLFTNLASGDTFYNPFFGGLTYLPAELALYDVNHNYQGDLWRWFTGSWIGPRPDDWVFVPTGGRIGFRRSVRVFDWLRPGVYYLQLVYHHAYIAPRPQSSSALWRSEVFDREDWTELFRSNIVSIRVVKKDSELPGGGAGLPSTHP
jgi:hypothetical protein